MKPTSDITPHVLTPFNTPNERIPEFARWLTETGSSGVTAYNYSQAIKRWLNVLSSAPNDRPAEIWRRWGTTAPIKRLTGYAARRWAEFNASIFGEIADLGIPSRLPASSKPRPRPVSDRELQLIRRTARQVLPKETGYSFRVWIVLLDELGIRRTESQIEWSDIDWPGAFVKVTGKTGTRELPLSRRMLRLLRWLQRRNPKYPWCGARSQKLTVGVLYNQFKAVAASVGLGDLRPHLIRHRRLTRLCQTHLAENQLLVLAISGHAHISSLAPYYKVSMDEKRALLNAA